MVERPRQLTARVMAFELIRRRRWPRLDQGPVSPKEATSTVAVRRRRLGKTIRRRPFFFQANVLESLDRNMTLSYTYPYQIRLWGVPFKGRVFGCTPTSLTTVGDNSCMVR